MLHIRGFNRRKAGARACVLSQSDVYVLSEDLSVRIRQVCARPKLSSTEKGILHEAALLSCTLCQNLLSAVPFSSLTYR